MRVSCISRRLAVSATLAVTGCGQILGFDGNYGDAPSVDDGGTIAKSPAEDSGPAQGDDGNEPSDGGNPIDSDGEAGSQSTIPGHWKRSAMLNISGMRVKQSPMSSGAAITRG